MTRLPVAPASRGARGLLLALGALAGADLAVLAWSAREGAALTDPAFERATGGFGLAAAMSAEWTFHALDPRGTRASESALRPLVGFPSHDPTLGSGLFDAGPSTGG